MIFNKQKIVAKTRINTMLWVIKTLRSNSEVFRQIIGGNRFWIENFDEEELMKGYRMHDNFVFTTQELVERADDMKDQLERDLERFMQIVTGKKDYTSKLNISMSHHSPENKATLEFLEEWGKRDAGLEQFYQVNDTIIMVFDSDKSYLKRVEIDTRNKNFLTIIADKIKERQMDLMANRSHHALMEDYIKNAQIAAACGLPSSYESNFSRLEVFYTDCFVLNRDGDFRKADIILDQNGDMREYDNGTSYGAKHWCQIFKDELVVQITREQQMIDGKTYYLYKYLVVVAPEQLTSHQEKTLAELANSYLQKSDENESVMVDPQLFAWTFPYSRIFKTDERFVLIPETFKEISPEYYEVDGQFMHRKEEIIVHVMDEQGNVVDCGSETTEDGVSEAETEIETETEAEISNELREITSSGERPASEIVKETEETKEAITAGNADIAIDADGEKQSFAEFAEEIASGDEEDEDNSAFQKLMEAETTAGESLDKNPNPAD